MPPEPRTHVSLHAWSLQKDGPVSVSPSQDQALQSDRQPCARFLCCRGTAAHGRSLLGSWDPTWMPSLFPLRGAAAPRSGVSPGQPAVFPVPCNLFPSYDPVGPLFWGYRCLAYRWPSSAMKSLGFFSQACPSWKSAAGWVLWCGVGSSWSGLGGWAVPGPACPDLMCTVFPRRSWVMGEPRL